MGGGGIGGLRGGGGGQRYKHAPLTQFDSWPYTLEEKQQPLTYEHAVLPLTHISLSMFLFLFFYLKLRQSLKRGSGSKTVLLLFAD